MQYKNLSAFLNSFAVLFIFLKLALFLFLFTCVYVHKLLSLRGKKGITSMKHPIPC